MGYPSDEDIAATAKYFDAAVAYIQALPKASGQDPTTTEQKLAFYGLFKQATVGPCSDSGKARPGMFDLEGRYKYDAWDALEDCSQERAKAMYVDLVAMSMLVGNASSEMQANFYKEKLSSEECPEFLKLVLGAAPAAPYPRIWTAAKEFAAAVATAKSIDKSAEDAEVLEGLHMQALYGDVYTGRPGLMDRLAGMSPKAWDAWAEQEGKAKDEAMEAYHMKVSTMME